MLAIELLEKILYYIDSKTLCENISRVDSNFQNVCYTIIKKRFYINNKKLQCLDDIINNYSYDYDIFIKIFDTPVRKDHLFFKQISSFTLDKIMSEKDNLIFSHQIYWILFNYFIITDEIDYSKATKFSIFSSYNSIIPYIFKYFKCNSPDHFRASLHKLINNNITQDDKIKYVMDYISERILLICNFFKKHEINDHSMLQLNHNYLQYNIDNILTYNDNTLETCKYFINNFELFDGYMIKYGCSLYSYILYLCMEHNNPIALFYLLCLADSTCLTQFSLIKFIKMSLENYSVCFTIILIYASIHLDIFFADDIYYDDIEKLDLTHENKLFIEEYKNIYGGIVLGSCQQNENIILYDSTEGEILRNNHLNIVSFLKDRLKNYHIDVDYMDQKVSEILSYL